MPEFKPNIYPIMYWGLMYGLVAGLILFILLLLSRFINLVWVPVFLAGVAWGGYRNYKKQKTMSGQNVAPKTALEEFKEAARDIAGATRDMMREQAEETAQPVAPVEADTTKEETANELPPASEPVAETNEPVDYVAPLPLDQPPITPPMRPVPPPPPPVPPASNEPR